MGENKALGIDGHMVFEGRIKVRKAKQKPRKRQTPEDGLRLWITSRRRQV
jgi:hypothetical protein